MATVVDMYETRTMLKALEQIHVPGDFLLTTFVNGTEFHDTEKVDIDIVRNGKKMAPFISPVREGKVISKEGFETRTHKLPYIRMKTPFTAQEALRRRAGVTMYNGSTPQAYIASELGKQLKKFDQMIFRREEWMAAQMIQTGKIVVEGDGVSYEIDTGMAASHLPALGAGSRWNESTADIQGDLDNWATKVYEDSGIMPTDAIIGLEAARAMLANESFIGALDRRRIDRGEINIERLPKGVKYYGYDRESGLNLWGYVEKYFDETADDYEYLIDPKKVIVLSKNLRFDRHYGMIQDADTDFIGARYPDSWITKDPKVRWISLQSAPAVINHQPDGVICAQVLV